MLLHKKKFHRKFIIDVLSIKVLLWRNPQTRIYSLLNEDYPFKTLIYWPVLNSWISRKKCLGMDIWLNCGLYLASRTYVSFFCLNSLKSHIAFTQEKDFFETKFSYLLHYKINWFHAGLSYKCNTVASYKYFGVRKQKMLESFIEMF